jgi:hypothetical protein
LMNPFNGQKFVQFVNNVPYILCVLFFNIT